MIYRYGSLQKDVSVPLEIVGPPNMKGAMQMDHYFKTSIGLKAPSVPYLVIMKINNVLKVCG